MLLILHIHYMFGVYKHMHSKAKKGVQKQLTVLSMFRILHDGFVRSHLFPSIASSIFLPLE